MFTIDHGKSYNKFVFLVIKDKWIKNQFCQEKHLRKF